MIFFNFLLNSFLFLQIVSIFQLNFQFLTRIILILILSSLIFLPNLTINQFSFSFYPYYISKLTIALQRLRSLDLNSLMIFTILLSIFSKLHFRIQFFSLHLKLYSILLHFLHFFYLIKQTYLPKHESSSLNSNEPSKVLLFVFSGLYFTCQMT